MDPSADTILNLKYVLVVPYDEEEKEEDASLFQGWTPVIQKKGFIHLVHFFARLPSSLFELTLTQPELLQYRKRSFPKQIIAAGAQILPAIEPTSSTSVTVFGCMPDDISLVRNCIGNDHKAIVVSFESGDTEGVFDLAKITEESCQVLDGILWDVAELDKHSTATRRGKYEAPVQISFEHGITAPNQLLLESLGFTVKGESDAVLSEHTRAEKAIVDTFNLVIDVWKPKKSEAIIYLPAVKAAFYDFKSHLWNQILRKIPIKAIRASVFPKFLILRGRCARRFRPKRCNA
jgi:hypothetical protein